METPPSTPDSLLSRLKLLLPIVVPLILLISLEVALEFRHHNKGFITPIFKAGKSHKAVEPTAEAEASPYGPTDAFPFRSIIPTNDMENATTIWIASASHAAHSRFDVEVLFPNHICSAMEASSTDCLVVNASEPGLTIDENIAQLEAYKNTINPDIIIPYQMSIFIGEYQTDIAKGAVVESTGLFDIHALHVLMQNTSIYLHLSEFMSSPLKMASNRPMTLENIESDWLLTLQKLKDYTDANDPELILTTFAIGFDLTNIDEAPYNYSTTFIKHNHKLSVNGFITTVETLNNLTRQFAQTNQIPLIELENTVGRKPSNFVDFVHFSEEGHKAIAKEIAAHLVTTKSYRSQLDI